MTILSGQPIDDPTVGSVCFTFPSAGGPWPSYSCKACYVNGTCGNPQTCTRDRRRQLLDASPCTAYPGSTECYLNNLESITTYK